MFLPIPFDHPPQAPLIVVEGQIGSEARGAVVVDTGATPPFPIFLSEDMARRLNLDLSEPRSLSSTSIGANRPTYRTATLSRLSIGGVEMGPVEVAVMPMIDRVGEAAGRRIDAIVGATFLRGRTVRIDYANKQIDFAAAPGPAATAIPFAFAPNKPVMVVDARLNRTLPITLEIDSGATGTSLSTAIAARARLAMRDGGVMVGAGGTTNVQVTSANVSFAGLSRDLPNVAVSPDIARVAEGIGTSIDGILGTDFMAGRVLTIDFAARRLWLSEG